MRPIFFTAVALAWLASQSLAAEPTSLSERIDQRLQARQGAEKITPAPQADDAEFFRRLNVDLIGRIPTADEAREFIRDDSPDKRVTVIRSMSTREGNHGRATDDLRTGYKPQGPIRFPVLGSLVSHECGPQTGELPHYVSILSRGLFRAGIPPAGFLGTEFAPLLVGTGSEST